MKSDYSGKDIQVLSFADAIRKRSGMYIGAEYPANLSGLVIEALCLSRALAAEGKTKKIRIDVNLHDNLNAGAVSICDDVDSPGICMEPLPDGRSLPEALCESLYACKGLKHETTQDFCKMGIVVVNALSSYFRFMTYRDGRAYIIRYAKGKDKEVHQMYECDEASLEIDFELDKEIFGDKKIDVNHLSAEIDKIRPSTNAEIILSIY